MGYYNLLNQLSWRTVKRIKPKNRFSTIFNNGIEVNQAIKEAIDNQIPFMAARYGWTELKAITNVISYNNRQNIFLDSIKFLTGQISQFWQINLDYYENLCKLSGFFPLNDIYLLNKFTHLMLESSKELNVLGVWVGLEDQISSIPKKTLLTNIRVLEPWFYSDPWTESLKGKNVLVIHPFKKSILEQYKKREYLFRNSNILPKFNLKVIQAVQTLADNTEYQFKDWFEALESMEDQIKNTEFDVAIIGCGAYGFPLAAYIKSLNKPAIHLGGMVQWLFGIKGKRWLELERYKNMPNEYWVFPLEDEKPKGFKKVEQGCYW